DARVHSVSAGPLQVTRLGDVQRAEATLELTAARTEVVFAYDEGTDVYVRHEPAAAGAESTGIRILRCRAEGRVLRLTLEGRGGRTYVLPLRTPRIPASAPGATVRRSGRDFEVEVRFEGEGFVRREIVIP